MKRSCEDLQKSNLGASAKKSLKRTTISQDARDFANLFTELQELRHKADYDPTYLFPKSDVVTLVDGADVAMQSFSKIPAAEQLDIIAFLLVKARS